MNNRIIQIECPEDGNTVVVNNVNKKYLKCDYVRAYQEGLFELAIDSDLAGDDLRVFLGLLANVDYENVFNLSLTALAKSLDMARPSVSRAIAKLVKKRYLSKVDNQGQINHYMVDPRIAFKTRASRFNQVLDTWDDLPRAR